MIKNKQCAVCGYHFDVDDTPTSSEFFTPQTEGAKLYYDLWHFNIEKCPNCGYASKDISTTSNRKIVDSPMYNALANNKVVAELNGVRPNDLLLYLQAAMYYKSINDKLNEALCNFQASDLIYGELLYLKDYNEEDAGEEYDDEKSYKTFADELYTSGINTLKEYLRENPNDVERIILLTGMLSDGDDKQAAQSVNLLNKLQSLTSLNDTQQKLFKFLTQLVEG